MTKIADRVKNTFSNDVVIYNEYMTSFVPSKSFICLQNKG